MRPTLSRLYKVIREHLGLHVTGIDSRVTRRLFTPGASVRNCNGLCCRTGATVSLDERDKVLSHSRIVAGAMTSNARSDPSRWFGKRTTKDADFTSGRTINTRVVDGTCVFYRNDGMCALQVAGSRMRDPYALKPAVCLLWPLCVQDRTLEVGYAWFTRRRECCAPSRAGARTILQVIGPDAELICGMSSAGRSRGGGAPR